MNYDHDDLGRLTFEIRRFLAKGDMSHRLFGMAKLYLEFPDAGDMHAMHMMLMQAMDQRFVTLNDGRPDRVIDGQTVEIVYGNVSIILTCKQRFAAPSGRTLGYVNTVFHTIKLEDQKDGN